MHCVVTFNPPYALGLRDYGLRKWEGGDADARCKRYSPTTAHPFIRLTSMLAERATAAEDDYNALIRDNARALR